MLFQLLFVMSQIFKKNALLILPFGNYILYSVTLPHYLNNREAFVLMPPVLFVSDPQHDTLPTPYFCELGNSSYLLWNKAMKQY